MEKIRAVNELRGAYPGGTLHIVGKGPSLKNVNAGHFGEGPVITINESVLIIQDLGIGNKIYSLQKDGNIESMVKPNDDVCLILQDPGFSEDYFTDHPERLHVDPVDELGFELDSEMSIRMCISLARVMGVAEIVLISCDSLGGDNRTLNVVTGEIFGDREATYCSIVEVVIKDLEDFDYHIVIPQDEKEKDRG